MSLDIYLIKVKPAVVWDGHITHNLATMATECGLYQPMWAPDEIGITRAGDLVPLLKRGLDVLLSDPDKFRSYEPENKWGTYPLFVSMVRDYLAACQEYPDATVEISK